MSTKMKSVDQFIGNAIRAKRLLNNKSLKDIGEKLDISFQQMQKYERGVNRLSGTYLYAISKYLNTPIEKFFPQNDSSLHDDQEDFDNPGISEHELTQLIKNYSAIRKKEIRKKFLELIKTLADQE